MAEFKPPPSETYIQDTESLEQPPTQFEYVIVLDVNIKTTPYYSYIKTFLNYLISRGIQADLGAGNIEENYYVTLHISDECVKKFAKIYDVNIENKGHNYIPQTQNNPFRLKMFQTPLSNDKDIFRRQKYKQATTAEKILVLSGMLQEAIFDDADADHMYGINKLIRIGAVKDAFPLHDGPYKINPNSTEPLNDRQLLFKYWANFSLWYKEQPLNLIEKYFGSEVAFYFAWLGFFNQMLISASLGGILCLVITVSYLATGNDPTVTEICESILVTCPRCNFARVCVADPLEIECKMGTFFVIFDHYIIVFFTVLMSFWSTCFIKFWRRYENFLKIRWNVTAATTVAQTKMRLAYKEKATHKKISPVTGLLEPYTPFSNQLFNYFLSFGTCFLLVIVLVLVIFGIIFYRIILSTLIRTSDIPPLEQNSSFIEATTSAIIQVFFIKIYGKFYGPLSEWLTNMENPRTQFEFDNSVLNKRYILGFANNYLGIFYMAFIKGIFYTPANTAIISFKNDYCHTRGCIVPLCIQLVVVMLLKSMLGNILTLIVPKMTKRFSEKVAPEVVIPQWEEEFHLYASGRYLLTSEFMEMIIQYGFVTFFVAAFPLAPLCALINNCMELRLDAYKLVTRHKRPVPKRHSGIGPWNDIIGIVIHLSIAINAFIIAFSTDFVSRQAYRLENENLQGYIQSTLSIFDIRDSDDYDHYKFMGLRENSTLCFYRGLRYPPKHPEKYELSDDFWYNLGLRLMCVVLYEHVILLMNGILAYFIPDMPLSVRKLLHHDGRLIINTRLKLKENVELIRRKIQEISTSDTEKKEN